MKRIVGLRFLKRIFILFIAVFVVALVILKLPQYRFTPRTPFEPEWGVTFSKKFAEELQIPWREAYLAILDDLNATHIRIPVYWDDISKARDAVILDDYRWMLVEAEKRERSVVLAVGMRLPRWPECHVPTWTETLPPEEFRSAVLTMVESVATEFKNYTAITAVQVENEPFVRWFGECAKTDSNLVKKEITLVRSIMKKPVIVTDSGEFGTWKKTHNLGGDILGITTYRVTWNPWFRYVRYPFPPAYYRIRALIANIPWSVIRSMELQAEPWFPGKDARAVSEEELKKSFDVAQFRANLDYARVMEVSYAYLWGAEWWYWQKLQGDERMWDVAKELWHEN